MVATSPTGRKAAREGRLKRDPDIAGSGMSLASNKVRPSAAADATVAAASWPPTLSLRVTVNG